MPVVNVTGLVTWDLTLVFAGKNLATVKPRWSDVCELYALEQKLKVQPGDAAPRADVETDLRAALKRFFPAEVACVIDQVEYDDLVSAFAACSAYYGDYLKKKREAAVRVALPDPASPPARGK